MKTVAVLSIALLYNFNVISAYMDYDKLIKNWTEPMVFKYPQKSLDYIPKTDEKAYTKGWQKYEVDFRDSKKLETFCSPSDKTLCTLHDHNGRIVGFMISIPQDNKYKKPTNFSLETNQWFQIKTIDSKIYFTLVIYLAGEDHIRDPGRGAPFDSIGETFRVIGNNRLSKTMPLKEDELLNDAWSKQNCKNRKGTHYLHKIKSDCSDFFPVVMLVKNKEVVGFTFMIPGDYSDNGQNQQYFEKIEKIQFEERFPEAPACLKNWAKRFKFSTLTITLAPQKYLTKCENSDSIKPLSMGRRVINWFKKRF